MVFTTFPVVPLELQILKPDAVIFFTGPYYEERVKETFLNLVEKPIEQFNDKVLARIEHLELPKNTFRTYHPKYLRLRHNDVLDKIVSLIKK